MKHIITIITAAALATGCSNAPKSHEVAADFASSVPYEQMTCERLRVEETALHRQAVDAGAAVDSHRSKQTGVEVITWVLFWPAAFALDKGTEHSAKLARIKGEHEAARKAMTIKGC